MYSDDKDSYAFQPFLSVCFQISANEIYFVWDSIWSFDSGYCKFGCGKTFRSLETKTMYESNKIYIRTIKLETKQYTQTIVNRIYCIYSVEFFLRNEFFKYLNNGYMEIQGKSALSFSSICILILVKIVLFV